MKKILLFVVLAGLFGCKTTETQKSRQMAMEKKPYHIIYKNNIPELVSFEKQSPTGNKINVEYIAVGTQRHRVSDIRLINMNDINERVNVQDDVEFPFWGKLMYTSNDGPGEMEFIIYEPGYWNIKLKTVAY